MPKGSRDGSVFKRAEERLVRKGGRFEKKKVTVWYARVRYTNTLGQVRELKRRAEPNTYAKACALKRELLDEAAEKAAQPGSRDRVTFDQLADHYAEHYVQPPRYVDGRKVSGLRSHYDVNLQLNILRAHFGDRPLRSITYGDIRQFRQKRLQVPVLGPKDKKTGVRTPRQRSIASVNRLLALLRRMLNVALREGWVARNPFSAGEPLITISDERARERILTFEEEEALLAALEGTPALRALVVAALETGMRQGELLKLRWSDVDMDAGMIRVRAFNTKTMRERVLALTSRLRDELLALRTARPGEGESLVFGYSEVEKTWARACRRAGLVGLRFHDLRHTAATRLVEAHIPLPEVGKQLGHTQAQTTWRYVNPNAGGARRAAAALDALRESKGAATKTVGAAPAGGEVVETESVN